VSTDILPSDVAGRLYRIGSMLINGYGYNWYRQENLMRADDLRVRSGVGGTLAGAIAHLRSLEARYRRKFLPPPTREHPDPDPGCIAGAQQFRFIEGRIDDVETRVRGAAVPTDDRIWQRHRAEIDTLQRLGEYDVLLIGGAQELADLVTTLPADAEIDVAAEQQIDAYLGHLLEILSHRAELLSAF
jgi:hypothetical protein